MVTLYSLVCMLAVFSIFLMDPTSCLPRALMDTSTSSPSASLGTRASETETDTSSWSTPSMTATGAEGVT